MPNPQAKWFEPLAQSAPDSIIVLDQEQRVRFANPAAREFAARTGFFEDLIGHSRGELMSASRIYTQDGSTVRPEALPARRAMTEGVETRDAIFEQVCGTEHYWISVSCMPIMDAAGTPEGAVLHIRDISQQKKQEDRLWLLIKSASSLSLSTDNIARLSQKARFIVPKLADWCTVNLVGPDGRLERVAVVHRDPKKERVVEEFVQRSAEEIDSNLGIYGVLRSGRPQFNPIVPEALLESSGMSSEQLALMRELRLGSSMIMPIISRGEVVGILSLAYAESGRHYSEEDFSFMQEYCHQLGIIIDNARLFEEVRKRDKAKERFLANLSHELRNPLAPIKSHLEVLKLLSEDERYLAEVDIIEHQFDHLTKLISDLLDVNRYALGKIELQRARTSLSGLITRIVRIQEPHINKKRIALSVELPPDDIVISADSTRLEQAVLNLLHNAEKFTPEGGAIRITASQTGPWAGIAVKDSGIGIESCELERIFNDEGMARPAGRPGSGLGIGLILVREIARLHGGRVEAQSPGVGKGSEFKILIPHENGALSH